MIVEEPAAAGLLDHLGASVQVAGTDKVLMAVLGPDQNGPSSA
jgi:hypothetical protein